MDDDPRVVDDAPGSGAPGGGPAKTGHPWLRRLGVALAVLLAAVPVGLQVQAARVRDQVDRAEAAQRIAELDEESAQIRLDSVGDRVLIARGDEDAAAARLAQARADMTAKGFEEPALHDIQVKKAGQVKELRAQVKKVAADIAEQNRLRPAADACLFDMLRALGDHSQGGASEACKTVAGHSTGAG